MASSQSPLLIRADGKDAGEQSYVVPGSDGWKYISFRVVRLRENEYFRGNTGAEEIAIVVLGGTLAVKSSKGDWPAVGRRANPFVGPPETLYLPASTNFELRATGAAEIALCGAPAREQHDARLIATSADEAYTRGSGNAQRRIRNILMDEAAAGALFLTEVLTPPGNWSSYPPHKHDTDDPPNESQLEELYYYRANPSSGFAFQRVYTAAGDLDETITAHDRDVVLVPRGYHVCAAAAEYSIYYLNVLAGPRHVYHMTFDPAHEWIKANWTW